MAAPKRIPDAKKTTPLVCPKGALFLETESSSPHGRGTYYARVPAEHTPEDVLHPAYFGMWQGERDPQPGDLIDIEPESAVWRMQVRVMDRMPHVTQMILRRQHFDDFSVETPAGFRLVWSGVNAKWKIFKGDYEVDADLPGYATQDQCLVRIDELLRDKAA